MISRVADHCFWLGRYLERTESTARVLQVTRNLSLDAGLSVRQCWLPVVVVSGEEAHFLERFGAAGLEDGEVVQRYLTWDEENLCSIRRSVQGSRENARSIREVVSLETYDFIFLGLMLERAGQTARILDVHHHALTQLAMHQVVETAVWMSLLRACSGFEPFMKRNRGHVTSLAVASFLVLEPSFPRSVRFAVAAAYQRLASIRPADAVGHPGAGSLERLRQLDTWIAEQRSAALQPGAIHDLLTHVVDETAAICHGIGQELLGEGPILPTSTQAQ